MTEPISRESLAKSLRTWLEEADLIRDEDMVWPVAWDLAGDLLHMLMRISLNEELARMR